VWTSVVMKTLRTIHLKDGLAPRNLSGPGASRSVTFGSGHRVGVAVATGIVALAVPLAQQGGEFFSGQHLRS